MVDYIHNAGRYINGGSGHPSLSYSGGGARGGGGGVFSPDMMSSHSETSSSLAPSHHSEQEFDMELTYITENIIALCFPDDGSEVTYRQNAKEVSDMLRAKHGDKYAIINLSPVSRILEQNNPQVCEYGFPATLAPSLDSICNISRTVASWIQKSRDHVVVFHCKGGIDRLACILAAYINYSSIYDGQVEALNRVAMKQFFEEQLAKWLQPSQARYVHYFTKLLTGSIELRSDPVYLQHVMLHGIPRSSTGGNLQVFIKLYSNMKHVYTSSVLNVMPGQDRVCVSLSKPIELTGDTLIKVYERQSASRRTICRAQVNTSTIHGERLSLKKPELDVAIADPNFGSDGKLELIFCSPTAQTPVCREDFSREYHSDEIVRWDSYANFHTVSDDSPLSSPSGRRKSVRVSRYFEDGPLEDSIYSKTHTMTSYSTMPSQTNGAMFTTQIPGNEYGITNVSSHGRVNITVIPPNKMGGAAVGPAVYTPSSHGSHTSNSSATNRYFPAAGSPALDNFHDTRNNQHTSTLTTHNRTVKSTTDYNPPANSLLSGGGQLLQTSTPKSPPLHHNNNNGSAPTGKEQSDLDEILRELLGESHSGTTTHTGAGSTGTSHVTHTSSRNVVTEQPEDAYTRERQQYVNPDGSTTTIEKRKYKAPNVTENITINKTSTSNRRMHHSGSAGSQNGSVSSDNIDSSGLSWLQQQQMKLNQRQRHRDDVDTAQRQTNHTDVVREMKTVHDRRAFSSSDTGSEHSDGQTYRSQKDIIVQHQPVAYTVLIKPEEERRRQEEIRLQQQSNETNLSKKSVTNVSHTHHTHYNFKDTESDLEQRNQILRLESELRNVKLGLLQHEEVVMEALRQEYQQLEDIMSEMNSLLMRQTTQKEQKVEQNNNNSQNNNPSLQNNISSSVMSASLDNSTLNSAKKKVESKPPRPPKQELEEEEILSFKPVGIASLESGTGATLPRVIPGPAPPAAHSNVSYEEEETLSFKPVGVNTLESGSGQTMVNTNTMRSASEGRGMHGSMGGTGTMRSQPQSPMSVSSYPPVFPPTPTTPYQVMSPISPGDSMQSAGGGWRAQQASLSMRQLRQASSQGYNVLGRSHDNLHDIRGGNMSPSPYHGHHPAGSYTQANSGGHGFRKEPLRRYASANALPSGVQFRNPQRPPTAPVLRISGDFEDMWNRHHSNASAASAQHKPVFGREYGGGMSGGMNSGTLGPQQRMVTETRHVQQSYHAGGGGQQMAGSAGSPGTMGLNSGQHQPNQYIAQDDVVLGSQHGGGTMGGHSQHGGTANNGYRYGYNTQSQSYHSGMNNQAGDDTLPHNQALHVNTGENRYATVGGQQQSHTMGGHSHGHVQFTNGSMHGGGMDNSSEMYAHNENSSVTPKFVKDTSKYWYKPTISRDEVINQLKDTTPGTFIVRDSNSFPGAFGLAVRVAQLPPNVQIKHGHDMASEYVRFYLIEPTAKGVKLKGCSNEPIFASLAALIYQHTITPLALPCRLLLPDPDRMVTGFNSVALAHADTVDGMMDGSTINGDITGSASELLKHGAACNVIYLNNVDTESLTGPQAISRAVHQTFSKGSRQDTTVATFKVSNDGITVTDTNHRLFFRKHFPREGVSFCGVDPADRRFTGNLDNGMYIKEAKMFGFVAKKKKGGNHCLLFAELDPDQPASAVVNFVTKVMMNK